MYGLLFSLMVAGSGGKPAPAETVSIQVQVPVTEPLKSAFRPNHAGQQLAMSKLCRLSSELSAPKPSPLPMEGPVPRMAAPMPQARPAPAAVDLTGPVPATRARLIVRIPAQAKLFVNGVPLEVAGGTCAYMTPDLQPGLTYCYTMHVEMLQGSGVVKDSQRVMFSPGTEVKVSFDAPVGGIAYGPKSLEAAMQSGQPVLVDFWAPWCGPCRAMDPAIQALAKQYKVVKINVDEHQDLASRFGVTALPTLLVLKGNHEAARNVGLTAEATLQAQLGDVAKK